MQRKYVNTPSYSNISILQNYVTNNKNSHRSSILVVYNSIVLN